MSDAPDHAGMAALVEELGSLAEELRALADDEGVPAVERNAARIDAAVRVLEMNLPPELRDD